MELTYDFPFKAIIAAIWVCSHTYYITGRAALVANYDEGGRQVKTKKTSIGAKMTIDIRWPFPFSTTNKILTKRDLLLKRLLRCQKFQGLDFFETDIETFV